MKLMLIIMASALLVGCAAKQSDSQPNNINQPAHGGLKENVVMKLTSAAFQNSQNIPPKYTCDGEDINPPMQIADVPENAQSLVLIVDDPDAPRGDWVHWVVWNILPQTAQIDENSVPNAGMQGMTDFGRIGWGGPCPPSGTHRYQFKLYALDAELNLDASAKKKDVEQAMQNHILDQAMLVGLYQKQ